MLIDKTKLTPARILVSLVVLGVILQGLGWYQAVVDYAGAGATVPLLGFGYSLAKGVAKAVAESGLLGVFTGGVTGAAGGIAAAIVFGCLFALLSRPQSKSEKITLPLGIHLPNGSVFAANSFFIRSRRSRSLPWRIPPQPR